MVGGAREGVGGASEIKAVKLTAVTEDGSSSLGLMYGVRCTIGCTLVCLQQILSIPSQGRMSSWRTSYIISMSGVP